MSVTLHNIQRIIALRCPGKEAQRASNAAKIARRTENKYQLFAREAGFNFQRLRAEFIWGTRRDCNFFIYVGKSDNTLQPIFIASFDEKPFNLLPENILVAFHANQPILRHQPLREYIREHQILLPFRVQTDEDKDP